MDYKEFHIQSMAVGIMLSVGDNPTENLDKVKAVGVDNVQMGSAPPFSSGADTLEKKT